MLDTVAQLAEYGFGNVGGTLGYEIHSDSLASDKPDDLLDFGNQCRRSVCEQGVGLVKEEYQPRKGSVSHFRKGLVNLGKKPEKEGRVELGVKHQFVSGKNAQHTFTSLKVKQVFDLEGGLSEKLVGSLVLKRQQSPLDRSYTRARYASVLCGILLGILADFLEHSPEVLQVQKQQPPVVGNSEDYVHHSGLNLVQTKKTAQQLRTHIGDGSPHRVAFFSEHVIEPHGASFEFRILDSELSAALLDKPAHLPGLGHSRQVSFHICHKAGNPRLAESFGKSLKRYCLSRTGGSGNQTVAVCHLSANAYRSLLAVGHIQS